MGFRPASPPNLPPVNTMPGSRLTPVDTPLGLILSVADPDSPTISVRLLITNGTMQVGAGGSITGNDTNDVVVSGAIALVNQSLGLAIFFPPSGFAGDAFVAMTSTDFEGGEDTDAMLIQVGG